VLRDMVSNKQETLTLSEVAAALSGTSTANN